MTNKKTCECWQEVKWLKSAVENLQHKVELQYQLILEMKNNDAETQHPLISTFSELTTSKEHLEGTNTLPARSLFQDGQSTPLPCKTAGNTFKEVSNDTSLLQFENEIIQYPATTANKKEKSDVNNFKEKNVQSLPITKRCLTNHSGVNDPLESPSTNNYSDPKEKSKTKLQLAAKLVRKRNTSLKKMFKCNYCEKTYTSKQGLGVHVNVIHKNIRYYCEYCSVSFKTNFSLRCHVRMHIRQDGFVEQLLSGKLISCQFCNQNFNQIKGFKLHLAKTHPELKNICCQICKKTFARKKYCNSHVLNCGLK